MGLFGIEPSTKRDEQGERGAPEPRATVGLAGGPERPSDLARVAFSGWTCGRRRQARRLRGRRGTRREWRDDAKETASSKCLAAPLLALLAAAHAGRARKTLLELSAFGYVRFLDIPVMKPSLFVVTVSTHSHTAIIRVYPYTLRYTPEKPSPTGVTRAAERNR